MTGTIATTIVLLVSPSLNADGRNAYSTRGQLFDGKVDRRVIVTARNAKGARPAFAGPLVRNHDLAARPVAACTQPIDPARRSP